jgi:geranylgeranyl diphosphate synthase type II
VTLDQYITHQQQRVDGALGRLVPPESEDPATIHRAMRYSLFAGGKRIRPLLAIAAAEAVSDAPVGIEAAACPLELIHTYSLIHDDWIMTICAAGGLRATRFSAMRWRFWRATLC